MVMTSNHDLYELIERIGNLLRAEDRKLGRVHGLQPVHRQALDYLGHCNRVSDTPLALSQFLGISKGTASQSILVLHNKKFINKKVDRQDRRVVHLRLTAKGKSLLTQYEDMPRRQIADASLTEAQHETCLQALSQLLREFIQHQESKSFGVCHTCQHFLHQGKSYHSGLIDEPLDVSEIDKICHEHSYP